MKPQSSLKYCLIRYLDYSPQNLPSIRSSIQQFLGTQTKQTLKYKQIMLTKQKGGVYSHGIRLRFDHADLNFKLEILQKYQSYLSYQFKYSTCQTNPIMILKEVGQAIYDIQEQIWRSPQYQLSIHLHAKHQLIEIRQQSFRSFSHEPSPSLIDKLLIILRLKEIARQSETIHDDQIFRPVKMNATQTKRI